MIGKALVLIRLGGISRYGENRMSGEIEILKIPPILKILILTNTRSRLGGISRYGKNRKSGEIEILKIPPILKILILTNTRKHGCN